MAFALAAMDGRVKNLLDVDIVYPGGRKQLWDFLGGRIPEIIVHIGLGHIPDALLQGDYLQDPGFRRTFQQWLNELWARKDGLIDQALAEKATH